MISDGAKDALWQIGKGEVSWTEDEIGVGDRLEVYGRNNFLYQDGEIGVDLNDF